MNWSVFCEEEEEAGATAGVQSWQKQDGVDAAVWSVLSELSETSSFKKKNQKTALRQWSWLATGWWCTDLIGSFWMWPTECLSNHLPGVYFAWPSAFQMFSLGYIGAGWVKWISLRCETFHVVRAAKMLLEMTWWIICIRIYFGIFLKILTCKMVPT